MTERFVDIYVWAVQGEADEKYGPFLTEEEADNRNIGLGGWGIIEKSVKTAQIACDHDCDLGCGPCSSH